MLTQYPISSDRQFQIQQKEVPLANIARFQKVTDEGKSLVGGPQADNKV